METKNKLTVTRGDEGGGLWRKEGERVQRTYGQDNEVGIVFGR